MGIERIHFTKLTKLSNEIGSLNQPVFSVSDTDSRVRFVGESWRMFSNINATRPTTSGVVSFLGKDSSTCRTTK